MNTAQLIIVSLTVLVAAVMIAPLIWAAILDGRYHARHGCAPVLPHALDT